MNSIIVYTDGSCHTQHLVGSWVAIVLAGDKKIILQGIAQDTTHHEMELLAVINAIEYVYGHFATQTALHIFSDSQYVTGLPGRREKLQSTGFLVKKGNPVQHADLVKKLFQLLAQFPVTFTKVPSHQKNMDGHVNYNTEADILSRQLVRSAIKKLFDK
ncbi:MAG TPA: RNase H family protein [Niastella sp.]